MKHEINISYNGYKYAPESFTFFVNGKLYAPRYSQAAHDLAMLVIQGKEKEARDKIKRDIRRSHKEPQYITIGFFEEGSKTRYFFTRQLYARRDDLRDKLRIYKEYKHFLESNNCIVNTYEVNAGEVKPGQISAPETTKIEERADVKRPLIIKLI
jgi:hypothetical protein